MDLSLGQWACLELASAPPFRNAPPFGTGIITYAPGSDRNSIEAAVGPIPEVRQAALIAKASRRPNGSPQVS
jgi:hypothetical protein